MTLLKRITIVLAASAVLLIILFFSVTNYIINSSFTTYIKENQEKRDTDLVTYLDNIYETSDTLSQDVLLNLSHQAMVNNIIITLYDQDKNIIWKSSHDMMGNMMGRTSNAGNYIENTYIIEANDKHEIYISIGQYESALLSNEDVKFKSSLNNGLILSAILGIIITTTLGIFLARKLSKPIVLLKEVTDNIREGNLKARVNLNTNTKELNDLNESINYLASTLEKQENLRKRLTSDVSHELRTPLNILQNQFEAIIDGVFEPTLERIKICNSEIQRLTNLVKDLEKLTSLDQTEIYLFKENYAIYDIISPVVQQFESSFKSKSIKVIIKGETDLTVKIDKDKMTQVMYNLLSNAYKFTEIGGEVIIRLNKLNEKAIISISDTGIGIASEDLKHIFERFYRVELSRNRKTGGAGLGLSIVMSIVKAHGGMIEVKSKLNEGTTFIISLPL